MNIYQLQENLLTIFDIIEENGGELTPELEKELAIAEEDFKDKVEGYTNVIKLLTNDIDSIKAEQKRLRDLAERKQKTIDRLSDIIIDAVEKFGSTKKSGVRYFDYGTGEVSIRKTKAVNTYDDTIEEIAEAVKLTAKNAQSTNQLDTMNNLIADDIISSMTNVANEEDLRHTDIQMTVKVPLAEILDGDAYPIIREIAKHTSDFKVAASISKTQLKKDLEENGACAPNVARLVTNKSITIK